MHAIATEMRHTWLPPTQWTCKCTKYISQTNSAMQLVSSVRTTEQLEYGHNTPAVIASNTLSCVVFEGLQDQRKCTFYCFYFLML